MGIAHNHPASREEHNVKRRLALLLISGLLAISLVGCGGDDKNAGTANGTDGAVTDQNDSALLGEDNTDSHQDDGTAGTGEDHSTDSNGDSLLDDVEDGMNDLGNDLEQGMDNLEDSGASYDQMVRNGSVHDTDGILTDGENAHTPGAA